MSLAASNSYADTDDYADADDIPQVGVKTAPAQASQAPAVNPAAPTGPGYWLLTANGGIFTHGSLGFFGSGPTVHMTSTAVDVVATPDGQGYWVVTAAGGVYTFGDAPFFGAGDPALLRAPVVSLVPTPDGMGYWMLTSIGGVFTFGDAKFFGSGPTVGVVNGFVSLTATPDGQGYWLTTGSGNVYPLGDAKSFGNGDPNLLRASVVSMKTTPDGQGYWLVTSTGGVFTFGDAGFFGAKPVPAGGSPVVAFTPTADGQGYWVVSADGAVSAYGDAQALPNPSPDPLSAPVAGIAVPPKGALSGVPMAFVVADHQAAATCPGLPWSVLTAIGYVESDFGRSTLPGVSSGTNFAGAAGPMQMGIAGAAGHTFQAYDHPIPGDMAPTPSSGAVPPSPYDLTDAVFAAARDLCTNGGGNPTTLRGAILAYNHSNSYADQVQSLAAMYGGQTTASSAAVRLAMTQLGVTYVWGGTTPNVGFDCSGLVQWVYRSLGVNIPRTSQEQWAALTHLPAGTPPAPGDLLFFGPVNGPTHVGMYIGNGLMIDAPHTGAVVRIEGYNWSDYIGAALP